MVDGRLYYFYTSCLSRFVYFLRMGIDRIIVRLAEGKAEGKTSRFGKRLRSSVGCDLLRLTDLALNKILFFSSIFPSPSLLIFYIEHIGGL